ncbi:hypothetical protein POVCU2_0092560 [Plasmodium ovale curtisi]|uniref:PIR Superfamily Protein n=1 Tax=Plasmodium ovale curtisi TaxID=864141 RepID=A0A1A8X8J7_PLAOA|nr:hypothetical protein POVCU2_0092560 [Plasmodium ovale curtisi]SBT01569.1 hypothetical protein POVCU1_067880 [Plasmodium ovale curtisi]
MKEYYESISYTYSGDDTDDGPLVFVSIQNPIFMKYKQERNMLYLSDQPIDSLKSSIISRSSTVGAIAGISSFLLYLYKYTSLLSIFRTRTQKNNIILADVNEGTHGFTISNYYL